MKLADHSLSIGNNCPAPLLQRHKLLKTPKIFYVELIKTF